MKDLAPKDGDLEPIETASRDEIAALQLENKFVAAGDAGLLRLCIVCGRPGWPLVGSRR